MLDIKFHLYKVLQCIHAPLRLKAVLLFYLPQYYKTSSLEEILNRYAFDIKLPEQVIDSTTGETTWAASTNPMKYITEMNMEQKDRKRPQEFILKTTGLTKIYSGRKVVQNVTMHVKKGDIYPQDMACNQHGILRK